jgi:hypothetical protein
MADKLDVDINDILPAPVISSNLDDKWTEDDDKILKEWVDKSACFKWLHEKSYKIYKRSYFRQMIPVIVISTITGAANFALNRLDENQQAYATLIIGGLNIVTGIISTVSQFLKTSEYKEAHNIAAKSWDKFNRNLKLELQRNPNERTNKKELFSMSVKEYDRLVEISPDIPTKVIKEFQGLYKNSIDLIKPEITGFLIPSKIYTPKVELGDHNLENSEIELNEESIIKQDYIEKFKDKYSRNPTNDEITEFIELKNISMA